MANLIASVIDRARADQNRNRLAQILETTTDSPGLAMRMGGDLTYQREDGQTVFELQLPSRLD